MIRSFADAETEKVWNGVKSRRLPPDIQDKALVKLRMLNRAMTIDDLRNPPGNRLEKLKGVHRDKYSIRVNDQWRVVFAWKEGGAWNVQIIDYH
jgi:proteic killer suppression protein